MSVDTDSMRGSFGTLFRRYCLGGTILGLKYLYLYPGKVSRCYWMVVMGLSLYFGGLLSVLLYRRFAAMPTRISIENQFEPVPDMLFPSITICSPNQVTMSSVRHFDKSFVDGNRSFDLASALGQLIGFYHSGHSNPDDLQTLQSLIDLNRYTIPEVMSALPQKCDRYLKLCFFRRRRYPGCRGLFKTILTQHGLCCIFNNVYGYHREGSFVRNSKDTTFKPHNVGRWGVAQGLTVVVDFEPWDAINSGIIFAGSTQVMITDWTEFPVSDETVLVPPHVEAFNIISATYTYCSDDVKELSKESRNCVFEDEQPLPYFQQYRNSDCDMVCLMRQVEHACHCLPFYIPSVPLLKACNITTMPCVMDTMSTVKEYEGDGCDCPRDCESRRYRVDLSTGNLDGMKHMIRDTYSHSVVNITDTTTIMHFFYHNSVYVKQKQETVMSINTLAANLGGVFGLCVGCSVVSLLEIVFYLRAWIINVLRERYYRAWHQRVGFQH